MSLVCIRAASVIPILFASSRVLGALVRLLARTRAAVRLLFWPQLAARQRARPARALRPPAYDQRDAAAAYIGILSYVVLAATLVFQLGSDRLRELAREVARVAAGRALPCERFSREACDRRPYRLLSGYLEMRRFRFADPALEDAQAKDVRRSKEVGLVRVSHPVFVRLELGRPALTGCIRHGWPVDRATTHSFCGVKNRFWPRGNAALAGMHSAPTARGNLAEVLPRG